MAHRFACVALAVVALVGAATPTRGDTDDRPQTITIPPAPPGGTRYQRVLGLLPPHVGCAVLVLGADENGEPLAFKQGYGVVRLNARSGDADARVTEATNFRVGSFTKVFTAAALLKLADDGALSLDDSVRDWLPGMPAYADRVTLRQMLDHTSGMPTYWGRLPMQGGSGFDDLAILRRVATMPPDFTAGTRCEYSNTAYVLLGLVVQQASGRPFHRYLREELLVPAEMNGSRLFVEGLNTVPDRAWGHVESPATGAARRENIEKQLQRLLNFKARAANQNEAARQRYDRAIAQLRNQLATLRTPVSQSVRWQAQDQGPYSRLGGDGALYTSIADLQRFLEAAATRRLPLSDEAYELWLEPSRSPDEGDRFGDGERGRRYTYGWIVDQHDGRVRYSHRGSTRGFSQTVQWYPETGEAVAVLMNCVPLAQPNDPAAGASEEERIERLGERVLETVLRPVPAR